MENMWWSAFDSSGNLTHYFLNIHPHIKVKLSNPIETEPTILWSVEIVTDEYPEDGVIYKFHEQSIVAQNETIAKHHASFIAWNWFSTMSQQIKGLIDP